MYTEQRNNKKLKQLYNKVGWGGEGRGQAGEKQEGQVSC
jgi:hypothetical protein